MLACAQLLTSLGVPSAVAWSIDGVLFAVAAVAGTRLFMLGRRQQPPVVAEAERVVAEAASEEPVSVS